ncbi:MAG: 2-oxo acid dehydrogenase subunit E2, partial [Armatimonadetes bacterium]|nr:2-oxo acid dehydrogenase subunit E2 [Armatimonadota bacterium]
QEYDLVVQSPTRQAIAQRVGESSATKPHFSTTVLIDATAMVALRGDLKQQGLDPVPTYNDIIIKATAETLKNHRHLNAWLDAEGLKVLKRINIAFAAATDQGVLLPVVLDADAKTLAQVAAETKNLVELARAGKLRASLQMGAGFTVSNIGPGRVEWFTAIISPPQVAILSVGALADRPGVADGQIVVRPTVYFTLTVDHKAVDGAHSAAFLNDLASLVEDATALRHACGL